MMTEELKRYRIEKKYSQEYVAHKLGISQKAYSKIEAGTTELTVRRLTQIAAILGFCVADLFLSSPVLTSRETAAQ
jgi:transcriptional regulator with XRE-family HTH domain